MWKQASAYTCVYMWKLAQLLELYVWQSGSCPFVLPWAAWHHNGTTTGSTTQNQTSTTSSVFTAASKVASMFATRARDPQTNAL